MEPTAGWFVSMAALGGLGLAAGHTVGRRGSRVAMRLTLVFALLLIFVWAWLVRRPAIAVRILPLQLLAYIEGIASIPLFMVLVGVLWARATQRRQKRLAFFATVLAMTYFLCGGLWMLQTTPSRTFATASHTKEVLQSEDYSCVAAASATALNHLDVPTTEEQMAKLTRTRPGTGATLFRALEGLDQRCREAGVDFRPALVDAAADELPLMPMPVLTALQYNTTYHHMVTLLRVDHRNVELADPEIGRIVLPRDEFDRYYSGTVIAFER